MTQNITQPHFFFLANKHNDDAAASRSFFGWESKRGRKGGKHSDESYDVIMNKVIAFPPARCGFQRDAIPKLSK